MQRVSWAVAEAPRVRPRALRPTRNMRISTYQAAAFAHAIAKGQQFTTATSVRPRGDADIP